MATFTSQQVSQLTQLVDRHTALFIGTHVGRDCLTTPMIRELQAHGVELPMRQVANQFDAAFRFGMLSSHPGGLVAPTFSYERFRDYLRTGTLAPLARSGKIALNKVRRRAAKDLTNLSHQILDDLIAPESGNALERSRQVLREVRTKKQQQQDLAEFAGRIAQRAETWAQRFHRISNYVMHDAFEQGRAYGVLQYYGTDAEVYKDVYPGACDTCVGLYLTNGKGSEPRRFKLIELLANGNNIGRRGTEIKAVVGPTHPNCRCTLWASKKSEVWNQQLQRFEIRQVISATASERIKNRTSRVSTFIKK